MFHRRGVGPTPRGYLQRCNTKLYVKKQDVIKINPMYSK